MVIGGWMPVTNRCEILMWNMAPSEAPNEGNYDRGLHLDQPRMYHLRVVNVIKPIGTRCIRAHLLTTTWGMDHWLFPKCTEKMGSTHLHGGPASGSASQLTLEDRSSWKTGDNREKSILRLTAFFKKWNIWESRVYTSQIRGHQDRWGQR